MNEELFDDHLFALYSALVDKTSGIHFSAANRVVFESKIRDLLRERKMGPMEYYRYLQQDPEEVKIFLDALTTNLTSFFRNHSHWDSLRYEIIPELVKNVARDRVIRIWSAGCSTGEEPYSLAMMFDRWLPPTVSYKIIACDLSLKSLNTASQGFYTEDKIAKVPADYLQRYFIPESGGYRVRDVLKEHIVFDYHNLMNPMTVGSFDLIFCRNVLIYFDKESFLKVIRQFYNASNPNAFLVLGHSETLFNLNTGFYLKKGKYGCYYTKEKD